MLLAGKNIPPGLDMKMTALSATDYQVLLYDREVQVWDALCGWAITLREESVDYSVVALIERA